MTRLELRGQPGSGGTAVGLALWVEPERIGRNGPLRGATDPAAEEARLRAALDSAAAELASLAATTADRAGTEVGAIFEAQALFARDPGMLEPALEAIRSGARAEAAIDQVAADQADLLAGVEDEYFRERAADLRDVGRRVVAILTGRRPPSLHRADGRLAIVLADDLDPSLVAAIRPELVAGVGLGGGAANGHAAIVARALGIPLVLGLGSTLGRDLDGHAAAIDGDSGRLILDPSDGDVAGLGPEGTAPVKVVTVGTEHDALLAASSRTGILVEANVGSLAEARQAAAAGAAGIGLVRTELLFLGRTVPPGLTEQRTAYRRIVEAIDGPVTIRTLDVGGDKPAGFVPSAGEPNPALGVRGIRMSLRRPELFETQVRAIVEAAPTRPARILLPMVSTLDELRLARAAIDRAVESSRASGSEVSAEILVGVMIEVPALALIADAVAAEVDFFSIGTNDLVQYTLAADRTNAELASLASPLQPAIVRLVALTCQAAARRGVPVAICGEAAANPDAAALWVGLGVRELSVSPRSIAAVHGALAAVDADRAKEVAKAAERAPTLEAVESILRAPGSPLDRSDQRSEGVAAAG